MPLTYIQKQKKLREYQEARAMFLQGIPLRAIGKQFGKTAAWAFLVVKGGGAKKPFKLLKDHLDLTKRPTHEADEQPR